MTLPPTRSKQDVCIGSCFSFTAFRGEMLVEVGQSIPQEAVYDEALANFTRSVRIRYAFRNTPERPFCKATYAKNPK